MATSAPPKEEVRRSPSKTNDRRAEENLRRRNNNRRRAQQRQAARRRKEMEFREMLGYPRRGPPQQNAVTTSSRATPPPPRVITNTPQHNQQSPPQDSFEHRARPPHMRSPEERRVYSSPSHAVNEAYRFGTRTTSPTRRQTVNGPPNSFQNDHNRRPPSASSSSSNENRLFGGPRGRQKQQVNRGIGRIPFSQQVEMRTGPIQMTGGKPRAVVNPLELRIWTHGWPSSWTTQDIYQAFSCLGNVSRVDIQRLQGSSVKGANLTFRPAPTNASWVGMNFQIRDSAGNARMISTKNETATPYMYVSQGTNKKLPERMHIAVECIDFGVMESETSMLGMYSVRSSAAIQATLEMNLNSKALFLNFPVQMAFTRPPGKQEISEYEFRLRLTLAQIRDGRITTEVDSSKSLYITCETPPLAYRKTNNPLRTFEETATQWDDSKLWFRQTSIDLDPTAIKSSVRLREEGCIIDLGRWLTYRINIRENTFRSSDFQTLWQALADHNINITMEQDTNFTVRDVDDLWHWLDPLKPTNAPVDDNPFLAAMHEMADNNVHLSFALRYQLEVCLSLGFLHECNMTRSFLSKLAAFDPPARAVKILEKVVDDKKRYYDPEKIFRLQNVVSIVQKKRPSYCTKIPSAVITPTTIYFATPVLETSNRVIRQYQHVEDRFLRVKFSDERHKGKIFPSDGHNDNEIFSRVSRAMTQGITIGDRHYEFLAFGSSQFREHGAYFFASTNSITAQQIRQWMGNFTSIKVVAKYCARLGQCLSTTRAVPHKVTIEKIPDIECNGFCFTDGAGKISPFVARLIATQFGLPNSETNYPSMFQFRLAGCKGTLGVSPPLKGQIIQIRPSQEKFPAQFQGLEICRISQFSTAYLNQQIILVLSALGIADDVFVKKLRGMLKEFEEAMVSEEKALGLLLKNIDHNQMTVSLAGMIEDGFMETQEPFMMSCLRLWRSWTLKYLKEKARICVDQGAFVLAGPDETKSLRGDFNVKILPDKTKSLVGCFGTAGDQPTNNDLPEIFLQIPDRDTPGKYKIIEEVCIIARNPSLHPGDVRKVRAVDKPALHHMKDVLILPVTGYRDLANMCSGGDLDGDDFMVIWDKELIPKEESHPPMDYTGPTPTENEEGVTTTDMAKFFVQHIKHDNLARIATAHRYWADFHDDGIKSPICLELAQLHSKAVDYAKTGVPAEVSRELRVKKWPHWAERKKTGKHRIYQSLKILGKLFDEVKRELFCAAWDLPFDERILSAAEPSEQMLKDAKEIKTTYDEAIRRTMNQYGVETEHEIFTSFVLEHDQDLNDYKLAETMGEVSEAMKQQHCDLCYERAGTDSKTKDWTKMKPFIVAMYRVTAEEVGKAYAETKQSTTIGGRQVPLRPLDFAHMPFMSFPWIFMRELGMIATKGESRVRMSTAPRPTATKKKADAVKQMADLLGEDFTPAPLPVVNTSEGAVRQGDLLDLFHVEAPSMKPAPALTPTPAPVPWKLTTISNDNIKPVPGKLTAISTANDNVKPSPPASKPDKDAWPQDIIDEHLADATAASAEAVEEVKRKARLYQQAGLPSDISFAQSEGGVCVSMAREYREGEKGEEADDEWDEGEEVKIDFDEEPSRFDRLAGTLGADTGED